MSYSNIDRTTDQPTQGQGHFTKHGDRTDHPTENVIKDKAEQTLGLGNIRQHQDQPGTDFTQGRDHHQMKDSRGLYDERDATNLGDRGTNNPFSDRQPAQGTTERFGYPATHETHHRAHMGEHKGLSGEPGALRDNFDDQERRTFPAGEDTNRSLLDRDNARNLTEPRSGIRDDEHRHRTFPAGDDTNFNRSTGRTDAPGNVTHTRADMRDDENRHKTFPAGEGNNVMSTGSETAGKVMDEGHNTTGVRGDTDRGRTFPAGDDTRIGRGGAGNVLSHDVRQVGTHGRTDDTHATGIHPHTRHHDDNPRHEGLQRTDDRVFKGDEHHKGLPGAGKEPYYGETHDSKFTPGQHAKPGEGHVTGTGAKTTEQTGHVGIGEKIRGTVEQLAGKLMDDPARHEKGTERKQGLLNEQQGTKTGTGTGKTGAVDDRY
jgi:hypothetical protein